MGCADGSGAYIGYTVIVDGFGKAVGDSGEQVAETQKFIRLATDLLTVSSIVRCRSYGEWAPDVPVFESPAADDGDGAYVRMRKACQRSNPSWDCVVEYNGEYAIEALVNSEGTIRRWNPDLSYREAYGFCIGAISMPNQAPQEESLGGMTWQWEGGGAVDVANPDRGFIKMYTAGDVEQFPNMPATV